MVVRALQIFADYTGLAVSSLIVIVLLIFVIIKLK